MNAYKMNVHFVNITLCWFKEIFFCYKLQYLVRECRIYYLFFSYGISWHRSLRRTLQRFYLMHQTNNRAAFIT